MKLDIADVHQKNLHHLLMGAVAPRPIAWVSTVGEDDIYNLAPYSAYCVVSARPAMVGFCVAGMMDGQKKDTLRNIESNGEFVINIVNEALAEPMNVTSAPYPGDVDEFEEAGLTAVPADLVKVPMVAESPVNLECRLNQILEFGEAPRVSSFIIGEILRIHISDSVYANEEIQMSELKAIGRLGGRGGDMYCRTTDSFVMKRPT